MFNKLPKDPQTFIHWDWNQLKPFAEDLQSQPITSTNLSAWVKDWSDLNRVISEIYARLWVDTTLDTANQEAKARFNTFLDETYMPSVEANQALKLKILEAGLQLEGFEIPMQKMREEVEIYRPENLPLIAEEQKLANEYDEIIGRQTVMWEGKEITPAQLQPVYQSLTRERRENAWRTEMERKLSDRQKINDLWIALLEVRGRMAQQAGFEDYRAYRWKEMHRFDYTPEDCLKFHQAIKQVAVPAAMRIYQKRQGRLGLPSLRPWDLEVDMLGRPPLRPFESIDELVGKVSTIFHKLDPELGGYFEIMRKQGLLDLENRKGKAPGAYCADFDMVMLPFIFQNAVGLHKDVSTLIHEGGHAFHIFEEAHLPYYHQLPVGMEMGEVASTTMELLSFPYLKTSEGGFYTDKDAARACIDYLEDAILFWPYMAVVDAFQHWAYTHQAKAINPGNCDQAWVDLWDEYMPVVDWRGLGDYLVTGWQRKQHIFEVAFYYIEYGMASLGALQIWANSLEDQPGTVAAYRRALALGGTASLPKLYKTAGARFKFDASTLQEAVSLIEATVARLESV